MMVGCIAYGCSNRSEQGFSMKGFPRDPSRRAVWIAAVNRENWSPSKNSRLCQVHFDEEQFEKPDEEGKIKLKNSAIPTIFLHKKISKKRPAPKARAAPSLKRRRTNFNILDQIEEDSENEAPDDSERVSQLKRKIKKITDENRRLRLKLSVTEKKLAGFLKKDQLIALTRNSTQGMLWYNETIKEALQLKFSCGTAGYECLLQKSYPLPSTRTLRRRLSNINFKSGILEDVLKLLQIKISCMNEKEKHCTLLLDEMFLRSNYEFDTVNKEFIGNVTFEDHSGIATHALVFMLAGISSRWKQTVAYFFTGASCRGNILKKVILEIISCVENIGLKVCSVVSDMGSSNQSMWKSFGIICGQYSRTVNFIPHPMDEDRKLFFMADVAHLLKNLRNMLINHKTVSLPDEIVKKYNLCSSFISIEHFKHLLKFQEEIDLKLTSKLRNTDLEPGHFEKMKVSTAKKIFNHSVSAAMQYLIAKNKAPESHKTTAWFVEMVDRWFTLMTSRHPVVAFSEANNDVYLEAVQFIKDFDTIISSLKVGKGNWKPVQAGIKLSSTSILNLQEYFLHVEKFSFLLTSRFTQDCLENLFSLIRAKQPVPSPLQFQRNLKLVCVAQYLKNLSNTNYDTDDSTFFGEFLELKKEKEPVITLPPSWNSSNLKELNDVEKDCLKHIAGYILSRVKNNDKTCIQCLCSVLSTEKIQTMDLSYFKNYKPDKLLVVNTAVFNFFLKAEMLFRYLEDSLIDQQNVTNYVIQAITENIQMSVELPNCHNIKQKLIRRFVNFRLQVYALKRRKHVPEFKGFGSKSDGMRKLASKIK